MRPPFAVAGALAFAVAACASVTSPSPSPTLSGAGCGNSPTSSGSSSPTTVVAPPAIWPLTAAADGRCGDVYLIAGVVSTPPSPSMWRWDHSGWTPVAGGAPALFNPTAATEQDGRGMILVGAVANPDAGHALHVATQTWRWSSGAWVQLHPAHGPSGWVEGGSLVLDQGKPDLLLAAGIWDGTRAVQNQLWQWDGSDWTRLAADDPSGAQGGRVPSQVVTGPGGVYGFMGVGRTGFHQEHALLRWTGVQFTMTGATAGPQTVTAMAYDPTRNAIVAIGSQYQGLPDTATPADTTYVFDGSAWSRHPLPAALDDWVGATMVADPAAGDVLLWGGEQSHGNANFSPAPASVTTWRWDGASWAAVGG